MAHLRTAAFPEPPRASANAPRETLDSDEFDVPAAVDAEPSAPSSTADLPTAWTCPTLHELPPFPSPFRHPLRAIGWLVRTSFGLVSLLLFLALLAAVPVANVLALGYLLAAQGCVARTGRLRQALPLLPIASRLGGLACGVWFWLFVVRLVGDAASDAQTIAPDSEVARRWQTALLSVSVAVSVHLILALARGGSIGSFFRPIKNIRWLWSELRRGGYGERATHAIAEFLHVLQIPRHFRLGFAGLIGTLCWLAPPTMLFAIPRNLHKPGQLLLTLAGSMLLIPVLAWAPFLQAAYAAEPRWRAFLGWRAVRQNFARAPWCWLLAITLLYTLALPLYLFKIAAPPRDALWFITPIFVATIYPAKIVVGWAYAQGAQRTRPAHLLWRWSSILLLGPLLTVYVFLLYLTPAIGAAGRRVLFEHHALLLPTPF